MQKPKNVKNHTS